MELNRIRGCVQFHEPVACKLSRIRDQNEEGKENLSYDTVRKAFTS